MRRRQGDEGRDVVCGQAQLQERAVGFRTGGSLQDHRLTRIPRGFGWRDGNDYDAIRLVGLYQWVMVLDGNFNWYVGAGGGLTSYDIDNVPAGVDDSETALFVAGDIGIEYNFDFPLLLSLDFRPELGFGDFNDDLDFDIALGIRYQF